MSGGEATQTKTGSQAHLSALCYAG
eukprot:SAG11_NODE_15790_length_566_cov_1.032120_1_plen_24_part_01